MNIEKYIETIQNADTVICLIDMDWTLCDTNVPDLLRWGILNSRRFYMCPVLLFERHVLSQNNFIASEEKYYLEQYPQEVNNVICKVNFHKLIMKMMEEKEIKVRNFNFNNIEYLISLKDKKVIFVLSSGSTQIIVDTVNQCIVNHTNKIKFDYVIGSIAGFQNRGINKLHTLKRFIKEKYPIIYFGDSNSDIEIWKDDVIPVCAMSANNSSRIQHYQNQLGDKALLCIDPNYELLDKIYTSTE